jgi:hypothetical protein
MLLKRPQATYHRWSDKEIQTITHMAVAGNKPAEIVKKASSLQCKPNCKEALFIKKTKSGFKITK